MPAPQRRAVSFATVALTAAAYVVTNVMICVWNAIGRKAEPARNAIPAIYTMIPCTVRHANCVTIVQAVTANPADSVEAM